MNALTAMYGPPRPQTTGRVDYLHLGVTVETLELAGAQARRGYTVAFVQDGKAHSVLIHEANREVSDAEFFSRVVGEAPDGTEAPEALTNDRAVCLLRNGWVQESLELFLRALPLAQAYVGLGAYFQHPSVMDFSSAKACLSRSLELNPNCDQAWANLAAIGFARNEFESTLEACARALELNPANATAAYYAAFSLRALHGSEAVDRIRSLLAVCLHNSHEFPAAIPLVYAGLAWCQQVRGEG